MTRDTAFSDAVDDAVRMPNVSAWLLEDALLRNASRSSQRCIMSCGCSQLQI